MTYADELNPDTVAFIRALPKAELHVHLEGTIRPATLLTLAQRHGVALPAQDEAGLRRFYQFRDFDHFIAVWQVINQCLRSGEDFALITQELGAEAGRQNIRYLEVTCTPFMHYGHKGLAWEEMLGGIQAGREQARREWGVEMRLIPDIPRSTSRLGLEGARQTAEWAVAGRAHGVVALGLGGAEVGNPPEAFTEAFAYALEHGLHSVPHAGEVVGPESIWGALQALKAERIGHGVRCGDDPALVNYLRDAQVPLELCPTSNVCTGAVTSLAAHPIRRLYDAGLYVTVNSDDPPMFNTTLTDEYLLLAARFGFSCRELAGLSLNAGRAAFVPAAERQQLETLFQTDIDRLLAAYPVG
jgi:adenosine deaminase